MYKQTVFTTITPIPSYIPRDVVIETLHNHKEMIELNPLVINYTRCRPPSFAPADEFHAVWYELTDRISYLPGGILQGNVSYKGCFYDLPRGLQTHVYAPTGLDIRDKWTVCGNMPGEPRETVELGLVDAPREGLYLREDVNMRCQIWATSFVKKTLKKAHAVLVDRLVVKADILKERADRDSVSLRSPTITDSSHRFSMASSELPVSGYGQGQHSQENNTDVPSSVSGVLPPQIQINGVPESKIPSQQARRPVGRRDSRNRSVYELE